MKKDNENNAKKLEATINYDINNKSGFYENINKECIKIFNKELEKSELIGGKKHKDILFTFTDGTQKTCEIKSSKKKKLKTWKTPWDGAVQYLNGTGSMFRIRSYYAMEWYKNLSYVKTKLNIEADIPTFEEFYNKDANMGGPKTPFGLELKKYGNELRKIKADFVKGLIVPDEIVEELIEDYNRESRNCLNEKECWLCIHGEDVKIWDKINSEQITKLNRKNSKDLCYTIDSNIFSSIRIRWQNGSGIANISVQCI
jgi:hypothetical protein